LAIRLQVIGDAAKLLDLAERPTLNGARLLKAGVDGKNQTQILAESSKKHENWGTSLRVALKALEGK